LHLRLAERLFLTHDRIFITVNADGYLKLVEPRRRQRGHARSRAAAPAIRQPWTPIRRNLG